MNQYQVTETAVINATPSQLYAILSDYQVGHRAILPPRYFTDMVVTAGGQGAGTAVTVHMNVLGTRVVYHLLVTEPEPGRILMEVDQEAGIQTTFTLDPVENGLRTRVTISTTARSSSGVKGVIERLINPGITRKIYREELKQLADFMVNPETTVSTKS